MAGENRMKAINRGDTGNPPIYLLSEPFVKGSFCKWLAYLKSESLWAALVVSGSLYLVTHRMT